jgi:hypothetical protein
MRSDSLFFWEKRTLQKAQRQTLLGRLRRLESRIEKLEAGRDADPEKKS